MGTISLCDEINSFLFMFTVLTLCKFEQVETCVYAPRCGECALIHKFILLKWTNINLAVFSLLVCCMFCMFDVDVVSITYEPKRKFNKYYMRYLCRWRSVLLLIKSHIDSAIFDRFCCWLFLLFMFRCLFIEWIETGTNTREKEAKKH